MAAEKNSYLNAVNGARSVGRTCGQHGYYPAVTPLQWSDELYRASYEHNVDMVESNFFSHDGSGSDTDWTAQIMELGRGSSANERIKNNGVPTKYSISENLASVSSSLPAVMNGLLASDGHCVNIMDSTKQFMGMARLGNKWGQTFYSVN
ncbi:MAG: CAP domain-containing protein [Sulfurovum sp.]|nr:CAP domain-containing protein [Sulfurovum sp.]